MKLPMIKENLMRLKYKSWILTGSIALTAFFSPIAAAQDLEPNDLCTSAQNAGALVPPAVITGSIDGPGPTPPSDVDFYRFTATPGLRLRIDGGDGVRAGVFSETCFPLAFPDLFTGPVDFTVPASGVFIIAAAAPFDEVFNGGVGDPNSGPYALSVALAPQPIGSISGRLVDAVTRRALPGSVRLLRCIADRCDEIVASQDTEAVADGTGVFRIDRDSLGRPILSGDFALFALANDPMVDAVSLRFSASAGQALDLGDVLLTPPPIVLSNIRPCTGLPAQGGTCRYSVNVRNNMPNRLTGQAFSPVQVGPTNLDLGFLGTIFEASALSFGNNPVRAPLRIAGGGASRDVTFFFTIPPSVPERTMICTEVKVGLDPTPQFNVKRAWLLFCLTKTSSGFQTMSSEESRAAFERMKAMDALPMQR
jgi:hypothetical protein